MKVDAALGMEAAVSAGEPAAARKAPSRYQPVQLPSPEQLVQEEVMNHPVTRTLVAGVLGAGLGATFGGFMGVFELARALELSNSWFDACCPFLYSKQCPRQARNFPYETSYVKRHRPPAPRAGRTPKGSAPWARYTQVLNVLWKRCEPRFPIIY